MNSIIYILFSDKYVELSKHVVSHYNSFVTKVENILKYGIADLSINECKELINKNIPNVISDMNETISIYKRLKDDIIIEMYYIYIIVIIFLIW